MSILDWIMIALGAAVFLTGAVFLLIGILKKKPLVVWKIIPSVFILAGILAVSICGVRGWNANQQIKKQNYIACRLMELDNYQQAGRISESAFGSHKNSTSAQLIAMSMMWQEQYTAAEKLIPQYQKMFDDDHFEEMMKLSEQAGKDGKPDARLRRMLKEIKRGIKLDQKAKAKAESIVNIQNGASVEDAELSEKDLDRLLGEDDPLSLTTKAMYYSHTGDTVKAYAAMEKAALADDSFPARAVLAQMAAGGMNIRLEGTSPIPHTDPEIKKVTDQIKNKDLEKQKLSERLQLEQNEKKIKNLKKQIRTLELEIRKLQEKQAQIPAQRAVNFIKASKPGKEDMTGYHLSLALLYFRQNDLEKAKDELEEMFTSAYHSEKAGYLTSECIQLMDAYDLSLMGEQVYIDENGNYNEQAAQNASPNRAAENLLTALSQNIIHLDIRNERQDDPEDGESEEENKRFSEFMVEALTEFRSGINIGRIDTTKFPEITVQINVSKEKENGKAYQKKDFQLWLDGTKIKKFDFSGTKSEAAGNVCMVVDHSGSMSGSLIENAKKAVNNFIRTASGMNVGLVAFDDSAEIICPVTSSTGTVQRGVDSLEADGGTNMAIGLRRGMEALDAVSGVKTIILLSDGVDGSDQGEMKQVLTELKAKGIVVYAIGIEQADSAYMSNICEQTGGKFLRSGNAAELGSTYQTIGSFLDNGYQLTFKVKDDKKYEGSIKVAVKDGIFDEKEYSVGVPLEMIEQEENLPPKTDYFHEIGGSKKGAVEQE